MAPASVPESCTALATMVESTVSRSSVEFTAWDTSPSARNSLTERPSSSVRVPQFGQQPCILNRDDCLVGEGRHQLDLLFGSGTISGCAPGCPVAFSTTHAIGHSNVNTGWTLGYGTEGRLAGMPGWTWRVETYYMDLGHLNDTDKPACAGPCSAHVTGGGQTTTNTHFTDWVLRGGLSYQFH